VRRSRNRLYSAASHSDPVSGTQLGWRCGAGKDLEEVGGECGGGGGGVRDAWWQGATCASVEQDKRRHPSTRHRGGDRMVAGAAARATMLLSTSIGGARFTARRRLQGGGGGGACGRYRAFRASSAANRTGTVRASASSEVGPRAWRIWLVQRTSNPRLVS